MWAAVQLFSSYWWLVFPFAAIVGGWGKAVAAYSERRRRDKIELARIEAEAAQRAVATSAPPRVRQLAKTMATHDKVNDRWFSYEMDLATLIDFPMLIDLREPLTEAFHRARVRADTYVPPNPTTSMTRPTSNATGTPYGNMWCRSRPPNARLAVVGTAASPPTSGNR